MLPTRTVASKCASQAYATYWVVVNVLTAELRWRKESIRMRTRRAIVVPAGVALALACVLITASALVGCSGDDSSSEATVSEVFGQDKNKSYSRAAKYGDLVWTAGHLPESASPGDSIETQTEAVMKDLEATLKEAGAGFDTVVMTNVYLANFDDWPGFDATYLRHFEGRLPPRVTVEVSSLAFGLIEISMVAHVRDV